MPFSRVELVARGALEQFGRIPAADEDHSERGELRLEGRPFAREFVAELHALDAGLIGFLKTRLERRRAADLLKVVVGPADRIGAEKNGHVSLQRAAASARLHSRGARRRPPPARKPPAPRRPTRSRRRRSTPWDRCR